MCYFEIQVVLDYIVVGDVVEETVADIVVVSYDVACFGEEPVGDVLVDYGVVAADAVVLEDIVVVDDFVGAVENIFEVVVVGDAVAGLDEEDVADVVDFGEVVVGVVVVYIAADVDDIVGVVS